MSGAGASNDDAPLGAKFWFVDTGAVYFLLVMKNDGSVILVNISIKHDVNSCGLITIVLTMGYHLALT